MTRTCGAFAKLAATRAASPGSNSIVVIRPEAPISSGRIAEEILALDSAKSRLDPRIFDPAAAMTASHRRGG